MKLLSEVPFTDLYLEKDAANSRFRGLYGADELQPTPHELVEDMNRLYKTVLQVHEANVIAPDFSVSFEDILYRVAVIPDIRSKVFALRRGSTHVPQLDKCGIKSLVIDHLLNLKNGLVLFCGSFSSGKTTAASAYVLEYVRKNGGMAITLEDPPELALSGDHGLGRVLQVQVNKKEIEDAVVNTLRMSFDMLFVSEIRTPAMAQEIISSSSNGKLIVATIHAKDLVDAVSRLINLSLDKDTKSAERVMSEMLANSLRAIVHMDKLTETQRAATAYLLGNNEVRAKIMSNELQSLRNVVNMQMNMLDMGKQPGKSD